MTPAAKHTAGKYLAVDLGAGSGRIVVGASGGELDIIHRFTTPSVVLPGGIHWDIPAIFNHIKQGLSSAFSTYGDEIVSISIDSWGVDYGLLDAGGDLIGLPYHYRDRRTDKIMEEVFSIVSDREMYDRTAVQLMQLNTIFQLYSFKKNHPALLASAGRYLSIPDLLSYWLCGEMANERTHASTTQLFSPHKDNWDFGLMDMVGLPKHIFGEIIPSGTLLAPLLPQVMQETAAPASVQVIAGAGHDTQAAAFTVPDSANTAFLSCGTWSVMGIENKSAFISDKSFASSASNEASARGGYNLLKNLLGLWLLQECKAEWDADAGAAGAARADASGYTELIEQARAEDNPAELIDINDTAFLKSRHQAGSMADRINQHLGKRGAAPCTRRSQIVRLILESLTELYKTTLDELEDISGRKITCLHIIGGGAQNDLLCELTRKRSGREVIIGHSEATAYGNILIQEQAAR